MLCLIKALQARSKRVTSPSPSDAGTFEDRHANTRILSLSCGGAVSHDDPPRLPARRMESDLPRALQPHGQPASNLCPPASVEPSPPLSLFGALPSIFTASPIFPPLSVRPGQRGSFLSRQQVGAPPP